MEKKIQENTIYILDSNFEKKQEEKEVSSIKNLPSLVRENYIPGSQFNNERLNSFLLRSDTRQ